VVFRLSFTARLGVTLLMEVAGPQLFWIINKLVIDEQFFTNVLRVMMRLWMVRVQHFNFLLYSSFFTMSSLFIQMR